MADEGRRVVLEGALNFRDIGGLPAGDGATVRRGRVYRSDSLHALTAADLEHLHEQIGLRTVFDLRMAEELAELGYPDEHFASHVDVRHLPFFTTFRDEWRESQAWATPEDQALRYYEFALSGAGCVAEMVRTFADDGRTPAVLHCHSGRDRTGVAVAVVLDLLGVDREVIGADYAVTGRYITDIELTPDRVIRMLEIVDERHGSASAFLGEHGLTDGDVDALRTVLLEPR